MKKILKFIKEYKTLFIFFLLIIFFGLIFFIQSIREENKLDESIEDIRSAISYPESFTTDYTDSLDLIYSNMENIDEDAELLISELSINLFKENNKNNDYEKNCKYLNRYLDLVNSEEGSSLAPISKASINIENAYNLYVAAYKCESGRENQTLEITSFDKFETNEFIVLSYYDNFPSEDNAMWLEENTSITFEEVLIEMREDALRLLIIDKSEFKISNYKQFKSNENTRYFDKQIDPFQLLDGNIVWSENEELVYEL